MIDAAQIRSKKVGPAVSGRLSLGIEKVDRSQFHWNANRRRYREAVASIAAIGITEGIEVGTVGFTGFQVAIGPEELDQLSEEDFVAQIRRAVSDLVSDHQRQLFALKREHLGR